MEDGGRVVCLRIDLYILRLAISVASSLEDDDYQRRVRLAMLYSPFLLYTCYRLACSFISFATAQVASGVNSLCLSLASQLDLS
jgi:hypothetical protein